MSAYWQTIPISTAQSLTDGPIELLELVNLNVETGGDFVSGKWDREQFSWINLTARASDSGTPRRTSFDPLAAD